LQAQDIRNEQALGGSLLLFAHVAFALDCRGKQRGAHLEANVDKGGILPRWSCISITSSQLRKSWLGKLLFTACRGSVIVIVSFQIMPMKH